MIRKLVQVHKYITLLYAHKYISKNYIFLKGGNVSDGKDWISIEKI